MDLREQNVRSLLSPTSGFIAAAGFTHSLTPARNCTFGCTYCYVPTMRVQGGLRREDWERWGQFTTFKSNAAELLVNYSTNLAARIYCSPLTDPYQPAEAQRGLMREILPALGQPLLFTIQTRGPGIVRDIDLLCALAARGVDVRISFSLTTNREDIRRWYEPHCAPLTERLAAMAALRAAGLRTFATLAPLLPCDSEVLADAAVAATSENVIGDPLHTRAAKPRGATTRPQAMRISEVRGLSDWHEPAYQAEVVARIAARVHASGREFRIGPEGFKWLAT
ncbi:MAG: hypothetical protein IT162_00170 [Bryobacterales bacterium]|nr:hypothetical protein [Bryobacterales bacterium]